MKKFILALIIALAVGGAPIAFTTLYDQPAKAEAGTGIDPSQMMINMKGLPVAHYDDYSVVFN